MGNGKTQDQELIEKQLADARQEAKIAFGDWCNYYNKDYEDVWAGACAKVRLLETMIRKRKVASGG